jgi:hypothetical protein
VTLAFAQAFAWARVNFIFRRIRFVEFFHCVIMPIEPLPWL